MTVMPVTLIISSIIPESNILSSYQRAKSNTNYPGSRGKTLHIEQTTIHTQGQSGFGVGGSNNTLREPTQT